jgi:glutaredoxin
MIPLLEIYSKDDCPFCEKAERELSVWGLPYLKRTLGHSFTKDELAERLGVPVNTIISLPKIFLDNRLIGGYSELLSCLNAVKMAQYVQERTE